MLTTQRYIDGDTHKPSKALASARTADSWTPLGRGQDHRLYLRLRAGDTSPPSAPRYCGQNSFAICAAIGMTASDRPRKGSNWRAGRLCSAGVRIGHGLSFQCTENLRSLTAELPKRVPTSLSAAARMPSAGIDIPLANLMPFAGKLPLLRTCRRGST